MDKEITFDEAKPEATIAEIADIDEREAKKFITILSLPDYVALVNAIQNKDVEKITEIFDKNESKLNDMYEGKFDEDAVLDEMGETIQQEKLDPANTLELKKLAQKLPKSNVPPTVATPTKPSSPTLTGTNKKEIVSANATTGTVAIKDPAKGGKIDIKSAKDPKNYPEITTLIRNAGLNIVP